MAEHARLDGSRVMVTGIACVLLTLLSLAATVASGAPGTGLPPLDAERSAPLLANRPPQGGPVDPERYRLGPGDVLAVWIWGPIARTTQLEVGPDGLVFHPELGSLRLAGLTLAEARRRLMENVAGRYRGIQV
jgi:hypothetical protein